MLDLKHVNARCEQAIKEVKTLLQNKAN
jgi:hypothetical protein